MIETIKRAYVSLDEQHPTKIKIARYIISGGTVAVVDLSLLYLFTDIFGIWYIVSAILAFLMAFLVSFTLQKYWTFKNHSNDYLHVQATRFFVVTVTNLGLNTFGIFLFVYYGNLHYIIAQVMISAFIAVESYFVYYYIFKET